MTPALKEAAKTINRLAKQEEDSRRQLCIAIAAAMDLVKKDSNLSWREWADENLRKPDGSKWSSWTLYSYASFGRDPKKLDRLREGVNQHGKRARQALRIARQATVVPAKRAATIETEKELQWLLSAWRRCSPAARRKFLEIINEEIAA